MTSFAVLGPGGVGGFIAAVLDRAGRDVTIVAREPTADVIVREGISVRSVRLGEFRARPTAAPALSEPVDVLFIATKAVGLQSALDRVIARPGLTVPLLNGLDHIALLRDRFGASRVAAAAIRIESDRPAPAEIVQTSRFLRIDLAADAAALARRLPPLVSELEAAEIPVRIWPTEVQALWAKLVRVNALACTTSASDLNLGAIVADAEWRSALVACLEEGTAVGNADGAGLDARSELRELEQAHPELGSSMQRDIAAGREPELDAIPGAVLRAAKRHGIECPTIAKLSAVIARRAGIDPPTV